MFGTDAFSELPFSSLAGEDTLIPPVAALNCNCAIVDIEVAIPAIPEISVCNEG